MSSPDLAFPLPPLLAGRYRTGRRLGQGSIAQVVQARDEVSGQEVALKVLYPNLRENQALADRFRREVQVVRRIEHPHVIRIHDLIEDQGLLFLVMELHRGGDLSDRVAQAGPLPVAALRTLARQICGALEAAHRAGVIHRDVKPQNILMGPCDELDARLCDFGLARTADLAGLTTRSTVLGTPEYMAPEVIGQAHADPRSDIYSMAVVLFEAATGRLPFRADSPYQLLRQHLTERPPRASELVPGLPPELDAALARGLAKEPLDRFASAAELAEALAGSTALDVASRPPPAAGRKCRRCGGAVVDLVQTCVDCGARTLRLRQQRAGRAVLVTGPGEPAHKIDGRSHVALVSLLEELPLGTADLEKLRARPPRLPFYLADRLDEPSATELVARLAEIGFEARIERAATLAPPEVRTKIRRMAGRYVVVAATMTSGFWYQIGKIFALPFGDGAAVTAGVAGALALGVLTYPAVAFRRPVIQLLAAAKHGAPVEERLAACLARLSRREDRRLLARLLDRLQAAARLEGLDIAAALGARAALAAEGLATLDQAVVDEDELQRALAAGRAGAEVAGALDRLREDERTRGVLVTDLLRTYARLDLLCLKLGRARALQARERAAAVAAEVDELAVALAAEEDLAALLGTRG
jgi:hypothetical protein